MKTNVQHGADPFQEVADDLASFDPGLGDLLRESWGRIYKRPHLSPTDRELCVVAAVAVQNNGAQLRRHLGVALSLGADLESLREVLIQTIPFAGWPTALGSLPVLREVAASHGLDLQRSGAEVEAVVDHHSLGMANGQAIYSDFAAALTQLGSFDSDLPKLVIESSFGRIYTRPGLDMRQREMIAVAMLAALQRLPQLESHIIGAHRVGCSREETKEVLITLIGCCGWPAAISSLQVWKKVTGHMNEAAKFGESGGA